MNDLNLEFKIQRERERAKHPVTSEELDTETQAIVERLDNLEQWIERLALDLERLKNR